MVQQFRAFVDAAPSWRLASVRRCVRACLDELASEAVDPIACAARERSHAARALGDARLRDPARSPGRGWIWRTIGAEVAQADGSIVRRPLECWTPPGFEYAGDVAAFAQRRREALAVALIAALHDEAIGSERGIDAGALAGEPIIDEATLEACAIDGAHRSRALAVVEARRRAWAGLRLHAMAERVEAQSWLAGAVRFLQAAGRDGLAREARRIRPESN